MTIRMPRRKVIQTLSLAGLGVVSTTRANDADIAQRSLFDREFEVIVIGSGFAGLAAAVSAAEKGGKVLVLEKMHFIGGNSIMSGGMMAIPGHPLQKQNNIQDSPELLMEDMLRVGKHLNHPELVKDLCNRAYPTFQWTEKIGVRWGTKFSGKGGHSRARCLIPVGGGEGIITALIQECKKLGVRIRTNSPVSTLLYHRSEGVYGVTVEKEEEDPIRIRSIKGVILAYGGFGADTVYRYQCNPTIQAQLPTTNQPGATSEMWRESARIGARQIQNDWIQCLPNCSPQEDGIGFASSFASVAAGQYGVWIDSQTQARFVNEFGDRLEATNGILSVLQKGATALAIADEQGVKVLERTQPGVLDKCIRSGAVTKYEDLQSLANAYQMQVDRLSQTLQRWNESVQSGQDHQFARKVQGIRPLTQGPYYVSRMTPKVHHCMGGVFTNIDGEVLSVINDDPIYGLFAAGECTGGIHGAVRIGACAVLDCLANGRKVGQNIMS